MGSGGDANEKGLKSEDMIGLEGIAANGGGNREEDAANSQKTVDGGSASGRANGGYFGGILDANSCGLSAIEGGW